MTTFHSTESGRKPKRTGEAKFSNAVRLFMDWQSIDATAAKELVRQAIVKYEREFLMLREKFLVANPHAESLHRFLQAMVYQISGHVVWSLNCPGITPTRVMTLIRASRINYLLSGAKDRVIRASRPLPSTKWTAGSRGYFWPQRRHVHQAKMTVLVSLVAGGAQLNHQRSLRRCLKH